VSDVTRILNAFDQGDPRAAEQLLPLVYDELRKLAAQRLAQEKPGQTLQATALVHEAYVRLVEGARTQAWAGRGHFFAAAAEAIRRILIERVRGKRRQKRGGERRRLDFDESLEVADAPGLDLLALDEVLTRFEAVDAEAARVVKLRYFAGLTMPEVADALGISLRQAEREWTYAKTWLHRALG
jgi:RNA polymerase sigma factor (TIGR02999 family)